MSAGDRPIAVLPDHLISQIAAGEVVERPASVVKETLENALDASAGRIDIDVAGGGIASITVRDDGRGMDRDDLERAFARHATSKIVSFEELEQVGTLGFRGEALAAIAAVSKVEVLSAVDAGEGHRLRIDGGKTQSIEPAAGPVGTTIEVRSLFFNVPARRKFLKTAATEQRRCLEVVQGYALARPDVAFRFATEERELLRAAAVGEGAEARLERIAQLFGSSLASNLVPIDGGSRVGGYVGNAKTTRGRRLFVFVNRRLVRDRAVMAVFYRSVRDVWKSEQFPSLFLFLDIPPREVDVNVHPQKAEVRFRDSGFVGEITRTLRRALATGRGEVAAPELRGESILPPPSWQGLGSRPTASDLAAGVGSTVPGSSVPGEPWQSSTEVREGESQIAAVRFDEASRPQAKALGRGSASSLRLLGQYKGAIILLEGPGALFLVDQHAAHERVLYETFRRALEEQRVESQRLITPVVLDLAPSEYLAASNVAPALEASGFELLPMPDQSLGLVSVPATLPIDLAEGMLRAVLQGWSDNDSQSDDGRAEAIRAELLESFAASRACRSAVKIHQRLGHDQMEELISDLFACEEPYACPHGRPTVLEMTDADLERRFGRR